MPTDDRSIQVRIADDLRAEIETGQLRPGQRLPTYDGLAAKYSCSVTVVRRAIERLRNQGLVITMQGKGSFVRERPRARRHGMQRYSRKVWKEEGTLILTGEAAEQGLSAVQRIRALEEVPAPEPVAERLGIPAGTTVFVRRRTTYISDRPNQLADSYFPLEIVAKAPQIREEETGPGGGFARLEDAGIMLDSIEEEIAIRMPAGPETAALNLPAGTPVAELLRTTFDTRGRPVEVMWSVIAGDMVTFDYIFKIPE
jgi:GntR family transcriptional regulator